MKAKTSIFRILDLHDLINLLENDKLRLRQASKMTDKNEAIGFYFSLLNNEFYFENDAFGMRDSLTNIQSATYITSWAHVADDIALWSLYSPNFNGVQIEVCYDQFEEIFQRYFLDNIYVKAYGLNPSDPRVFIREQQVGSVEYSNFQDKHHKYSKIRKEYRQFLAENYDHEDFKNLIKEWRNKNFSDFDHSKSYLQKDKRYLHEKEVRGILQICKRDDRTVEEYEAHPMAGLDSPTEIVPAEDCPENIFIPIPKDFVRSIKLDSRLPDWKLFAVKKILEKYEIEVSKTEAFSPEYDKGQWF